MTKQEILDVIKENVYLTLETIERGYTNEVTHEIRLKVNGETTSEISIEMEDFSLNGYNAEDY